MPPLSLLTWLWLALATWRVASLLGNVAESGPWGILDRIRYWAGVRYDERSQPYGATGLARGLLCRWCCSLWVGAAWTALALLWPAGAAWLALPLALSAAAIALERWITDG